MIFFSSVPHLCSRAVFSMHAYTHTHMHFSFSSCMHVYIHTTCVRVCVCARARAHTVCVCVCTYYVHTSLLHTSLCVWSVCARADIHVSKCLSGCQSLSQSRCENFFKKFNTLFQNTCFPCHTCPLPLALLPSPPPLSLVFSLPHRK